jgi:hypothetical protein
MDDSTRVWCSVPKGVHMRHHIMAEARFVRVGVGEIDVIYMRTQFCDLRGGHRESKFVLRLRQC